MSLDLAIPQAAPAPITSGEAEDMLYTFFGMPSHKSASAVLANGSKPDVVAPCSTAPGGQFVDGCSTKPSILHAKKPTEASQSCELSGERQPTKMQGSRANVQKDLRPRRPALARGVKGGWARAMADSRSLSDLLSDLGKTPSERVFVVRRIGILGLEPAGILKQHFESQGAVDRVLVPSSHVRSTCQRFIRRVRPANLAFVVMRDSADVEKTIAEGCDQVILGHAVCVERYNERQPPDEKKQDGREDTCASASTDDGDDSAWRTALTSEPSIEDSASVSRSTGSDCGCNDECEDCCEVTADFEYWPTDDEWL